jgi:hypothetical protein
MTVPSIKGVAFQFLANAIEQDIAEGKFDRAAFEAKVAEEDLEILQGEIFPGLWYPIESFGRLLALTFEMQGRPRGQWAQAGFESAEKVFSTGAYGSAVGAASNQGERSGFALVHLVPLFLNFSSWSFEQDPGDGSIYHVTAEGAAPMPEAFVALVQGVLEYFSVRVRGYRVSVSSERLGRDRILFRAVPAEKS